MIDYPPPQGWTPEDFPQLTIDHIPHTSNPWIRPDPLLWVTQEGWLYVETGGHRIAFPDREEWQKFVHIGNATWNDYERVLRTTTTTTDAASVKENSHADDDEADAG